MDGFRYVFTPLSRCVSVDALISFHYYEYAASFEGVEESHDFWELVYVDSGKIMCLAGALTLPLSPGQAVLHPPGERHNIFVSGAYASVCITSFSCPALDADRFRGHALQLTETERSLMTFFYRACERLFLPPYNLLRQARLEINPDAPAGAAQLVRTLLESLLIYLLQKPIEDEEPVSPAILKSATVRRSQYNDALIIQQVMRLMNEHIVDHMTMRDISRSVAFSESHIQNVFRKQTGMSVIHYFNKLKIDRAKRMIAEGRYSYTQISATLGFSSVHYFSRIFRQYVNMSPSEYERSVTKTSIL